MNGSSRITKEAVKWTLLLLVTMLLTVQLNIPAMAAGQTHTYYKGVPKEGVALADSVAQGIAASIMSNPAYTTDLAKVNAAAAAVASYASAGVYGVDSNKFYKSPYGVFVTGNYTCAGTTRALGRVLDYMGYPYIHMNENQWHHQWNVLIMDGQTGFADGMGGYAGYGDYASGMTLSDGTMVVFQ